MPDIKNSQRIKIKLRSFDHALLDSAAREIVLTAERSGADVSGPVPLPVEIYKFTVNKSPHIDKKSREQFERRTQKRLVYITCSSHHTMNSLMQLELPAGVEIDIKVLGN